MEDTRNLTFPQQTQPSMFQGQGMQVQPMQGQGMQGQGMPGQGMQAQSLPQHLQHGMAPFPNMNPAYSSHSQFYPQPRQSQQMQAQPGQNPQQQQQQGMAGQVPLAQVLSSSSSVFPPFPCLSFRVSSNIKTTRDSSFLQTIWANNKATCRGPWECPAKMMATMAATTAASEPPPRQDRFPPLTSFSNINTLSNFTPLTESHLSL